MSHSVSAIVSLLLAVLVFAAMQAFRSSLSEGQGATILGGFAGSSMFLFLLTGVSNFEMEFMGKNFQAKLFPEVVGCLLVAMFASGLVHRVCVTTCLIFSIGLLYVAHNISNSRYGPSTAPVVAPVKKRK